MLLEDVIQYGNFTIIDNNQAGDDNVVQIVIHRWNKPNINLRIPRCLLYLAKFGWLTAAFVRQEIRRVSAANRKEVHIHTKIIEYHRNQHETLMLCVQRIIGNTSHPQWLPREIWRMIIGDVRRYIILDQVNQHVQTSTRFDKYRSRRFSKT